MHILTPSIFCALLSLAACEKIDDSDFAQATGGNATETTTETHGQDDILQEQPDGSLLMPTEEHAIALSETADDGSRKVLYISLYEWDDVASAYSEAGSSMAADIASKYVEGDVTGWRIPTKEEGIMLRTTYGCYPPDYSEALLTLNASIVQCGGQELRSWELKDSYPSYRYLCEDATYTFSLKTGSNATKAGAKTKYHLRLVKDSIF